MNKQFADEMIEQFSTKFFGFALGKCRDLDEAEELAARITYEAYLTLRQMDEIYNWEGYLYKIASNVYVKYVKERQKNQVKDIDELEICDEYDVEADFSHKEELEQIKKEVAWLGKRHREIVILHYYHNRKIAEIAKQLELPEGTVKWHLSDAKKQLKKGMQQMRRKGNLGIEPITLAGLGSMGMPGELGDTSYFLNSKLKQNIAYAAYFHPKSKLEIAEELGVSPVYIEDEVDYLEEYGFLDLLPGQKYRTNIFITDIPYDAVQKSREVDQKVAKLICDEYIPKALEYLKQCDRKHIYIPNNDWNFFLWSMLPMMVCEIGVRSIDWERMRKKNYLVKRKDGGDFAALSVVYNEDLLDEHFYHEMYCGPMYKCCEKDIQAGAWSLSTEFDTREFGWKDNLESDYVALYMYMKGELPKTEGVLDKYVRLYDRGLLVNVDGKDQVNIIVQKAENDIKENFGKMVNRISLPVSKELQDKIEGLLQKKMELEKIYYPEHMHDMLEIRHRTALVHPVMVVDELLERGILKQLTEVQKKGVMNILYADMLPVSEGFLPLKE